MDYLYFQELYHHGIKGQKWGYRRYTNEDGSLTEEGKARYGYNEETGKMNATGKEHYKLDQRAIRGQRIYENGDNITSLKRKDGRKALAAGFGAEAAFISAAYLATKYSDVASHAGTPKQKAVVAGLLATSGALAATYVGVLVSDAKKTKDLRAFAVNGPKQYQKINGKK